MLHVYVHEIHKITSPVAIYFPAKFSGYTVSLHTVLQTLPPSIFCNFILLGDFNVNFLDPSITGFCELNNILSFNLTQIVQDPTRMLTLLEEDMLPDMSTFKNLIESSESRLKINK